MRAGKTMTPGFQLNHDDHDDCIHGDTKPTAICSLQVSFSSDFGNLKPGGNDILKREPPKKRSRNSDSGIEDNKAVHIPAVDISRNPKTQMQQTVNRKPPKKRFQIEESEREDNDYVQTSMADHEGEEGFDVDIIDEQLKPTKSEAVENRAYAGTDRKDINFTANEVQTTVHVEGRSLYSMRKGRLK
jgi:hypothetical protein